MRSRALSTFVIARALDGADETLAGEAAAHWAAAGRPADELPARMAAGAAAERVFGYVEAAVHWQRAIELCEGAAWARPLPGGSCITPMRYGFKAKKDGIRARRTIRARRRYID